MNEETRLQNELPLAPRALLAVANPAAAGI